jgi:hypothetical protein
MGDLVGEYLDLEHDLLTRRLRRLLAGIPATQEDPEEERFEDEFERIWKAMSATQRQRLHGARDLRSAPRAGRVRRPGATSRVSGDAGTSDDWGAGAGGGYVIRTRALPEGVELSIPATTPTSLRRPSAHIARMILDAEEFERLGARARSALVDSALALLGRGLDDVREQGGLRFIDPETGEELMAAAVEPSGVAESPERRPSVGA